MRKKGTYISRSVIYLPALAGLFIAAAILLFWNSDEEEKPAYDNPDGYADYYSRITISPGQKHSGYKSGYQITEYKTIKSRKTNFKQAKRDFNWEFRGPGNVGGRTREVLIDPDDPSQNTWFAAAASGGVWRTTNAGQSWENLTEDLINLATNSLAMAASNHNVLYIGTGEGYGGFGMVSGNGIFRSSDRGASWTHLESTSETEIFRWINKIIVDETNEDIVIVAGNEGIYKTYDGGLSWDTVYNSGYAVQDIKANSMNSRTMYAAVNSLGIIKSYDGGDTWSNAHQGIGTGYRFSMDVSPVDSNYVFACAEAPELLTEIYISKDGAASWRKLKDSDFTFYNFLGDQGWFNNVIKADPFEKDKIFIGGVYFGSITFKPGTGISEPQVLRVDTLGTGSFLDFVDFGGEFLHGGLTTGIEENAEVEAEDFVSVELRFGPGIGQFAHRFTVPEGEGAGVPPYAYSYQDYIEVPFEAWDTDNNRQLMISFRDQTDNEIYDLIEREWDDEISGREYLFIHAIEYNTIPNPAIAVDGGHYNKMLYFVWPTLPEDKLWQADNLPVSSIKISYGTFQLQDASTTILADDTRNSNLHVDHHSIDIVLSNEINQEYLIIEANDGGIGVSHDKGLSWEQKKSAYPTTQFYGVAKKPSAHEYIGGMQDNGTWQSPQGETANAFSEYEDRVAGDGFEALWHPEYPHRILASSYFNIIRLSTDGGETWDAATEGITGSGPFITRLANSPDNPDLVFAVGNYGVYRHTNFCVGRYPWELVQIDSGWSAFNQVTSSHNVEVSLADPSVVWAGAGLFEDPDLYIFLSKDFGESFEKVNLYPEREMGYITGIATHPHDSATAYLLFSMDHKPKILRTEDFGENWEDITGFGADSTSSIFPDVIVYSLLVFPDEPERLWAGTEIGIIESSDNGVSWQLADNGFPAVSVWQMFIQDQTLVTATHGRGIWTASLYPNSIEDSHNKFKADLKVYPNPTSGILNIEFESLYSSKLKLEVYTLSGSLIFSDSIIKNALVFNKQIDLSGYSKGSYFISIQYDGLTYTKRIILN